MNNDGRIANKLLRANTVDGVIVAVVCTLVVVGYLRFSEPFRTARPGGESVGESLAVELCVAPGSDWLIQESFAGAQDHDPRFGAADAHLLEAYTHPDGSTRVRMDLMVQRNPDGSLYFRGRPLVLGMRLQFNTSVIVVEGSLCSLGPGDSAQ